MVKPEAARFMGAVLPFNAFYRIEESQKRCYLSTKR